MRGTVLRCISFWVPVSLQRGMLRNGTPTWVCHFQLGKSRERNGSAWAGRAGWRRGTGARGLQRDSMGSSSQVAWPRNDKFGLKTARRWSTLSATSRAHLLRGSKMPEARVSRWFLQMSLGMFMSRTERGRERVARHPGVALDRKGRNRTEGFKRSAFRGGFSLQGEEGTWVSIPRGCAVARGRSCW